MKISVKNIMSLTSACLIFTLTACGNGGSPENTQAAQTQPENAESGSMPQNSQTEAAADSGETESVPPRSGENMPEPFYEGADGDMNDGFYLPCTYVLNNIPTALMRLENEDEVSEWINSFPSVKTAPSDITEYENIYSFITDFSVTREAAEEALAYYLDNNMITVGQLDIIFSGDKGLVTESFAAKYSIAVGEKIYCPNWLYTHSAEDYAEAGITAAMVSEKVPYYSELGLNERACAAFAEKLSDFTGEEIELTPLQNTHEPNPKEDEYDIAEDLPEEEYGYEEIIDELAE